ncbi:MAG: hypothetical protein IT426_04515 [Pirellulales bacterium]|nr:hypothetical protein [Pirellulales bacterium]
MVQKAILLEMKDAEIAARVTHDRQTKTLGQLTGDRYLTIPEKGLQAFRATQKKLGYVLPQ